MDQSTESLEKLFQSHIESEKISISRIMCILGALLCIIFIAADYIALSATLSEVLFARGIVVATLLSAFLSTYHKSFIKYYDQILLVVYLVTAAGIEAMIYLAMPEDHASNVYFAGLLLVIMTIFAWSYLRLEVSFLATIIIIGSYADLGLKKDLTISELLVNILFLLSAASIGLVSQLIRDRHLRENFLLTQSLKESVKEKTEEAKDNAHLANHDSLTGLPNRRYITELLEQSLIKAKEENRVLAIMFLDLNSFKQVNDVHGHSFGDEVLRIVAKRLELAIRHGDYLSRLGGDEYLISLLLEEENLSEVDELAEKFTKLVLQPMNINGTKIKIAASIGIAAYPIHGNKISTLLDIADKRMYKVKGRDGKKGNLETKKVGKDAVVIFPGKLKQL